MRIILHKRKIDQTDKFNILKSVILNAVRRSQLSSRWVRIVELIDKVDLDALKEEIDNV